MHTSRSSCLLYICINKILFNVVLKNTIINKMAAMKKLIISVLLLLLAENVMFSREKSTVHGYPITPVPFTAVELTDSFWGQRLEASRKVTIPLAFSKCEETGRYRNFEMAAHPERGTHEVGGCLLRK